MVFTKDSTQNSETQSYIYLPPSGSFARNELIQSIDETLKQTWTQLLIFNLIFAVPPFRPAFKANKGVFADTSKIVNLNLAMFF